MAAWYFDTPAGVRDFTDPSKWHETMAKASQDIVLDLVATVLNKDPRDVTEAEVQQIAPDLGYVDPVSIPLTSAGETLAIAPWPAFPRAVVRRGPWTEFPHQPEDPQGNYRAAEHIGDEDHRAGVFEDKHGAVLDLPARDRQDEYLEWAVRRDLNGKLIKVIFVAEGYDYYSELFKHDEAKVVDLYQEFTGIKSITADQLRAPRGIIRRLEDGRAYQVAEEGGFNPRNRFNLDPGIVHLSHRANSLGAEINLAGVSGILRSMADGTVLSGADPEELLCCCQGGSPNRNSDPLISAQAYAQVKNGYRYTLANPVGLYIAGADHDRVQTKDGEPLTNEWWTEIRGDGFRKPQDITNKDSRVLRLELAPPPGSNLTLEDLEVDGVPVRFAGQLANLILVHLFVTRWERSTQGEMGPKVPCIGTCCRKTGTSQLAITEGKCPTGYQLAFPGLLADSPPAPLIDAVGATVSPTSTIAAKNLVPELAAKGARISLKR